eukprot:CAMPEP_0117448558 /NCGR_PEP_ID=MMETSP0759-20121206/7467_1 /TAXON_ID=63605 /ORGANISM="Percolomonas cosmopolitus, Strain WS" /LENGTH=200 /DNA_ID=CAMNT_0005240957 /DNA_START=41 /DNA_END=643 /DNA_ORIENTATION=+
MTTHLPPQPRRTYFDIPNPFEPYTIINQHIKADLKDLQDNQNKQQQKQKKVQKAQKERFSKTKKNQKDDSFCNKYFVYIMVAVFVALVVVLMLMKMQETDFSISSKYAAKDYYGMLGAKKGDTTRAIKRAYRKAVVKWHPDRNPNCGEECIKKMSDINEAYMILLNPETRAFHDRHGTEVPDNLIKLAKEKSGSHRGAKD